MAARKSIFDRYTRAQLLEFKREYLFNRQRESMQRAAAGAMVNHLCTIKEWNSKNAAALFDDALAIAMRIEGGVLFDD